jgi:tetratricopeptide (TPR) repeat protein
LRRGELLVGAIADLVLEESRVQPVTVVFEDVEPEDSLTRAVVHSLTRRAADARILVLVCSRPEGRHHWASLPDARVLRLDAMGREAIGLLVRAMLGDDTSVLEARDFVCERAQGNPLFAEEMVRSLADSGAITGTRGGFVRTGPLDPKQLPDRVEAVLAARLDRLPRLHKSVLQHAAVIGSVVPLPVLQSIVELDAGPLSRVLADLQSAEFLIETRLYPEHEMAFKHALVHEVAYAELLRERRREIHARIVPVMAEVYRDRLEDISEQVAEHALRGELWDEAIRYSRSAGTRAADRYAYGKAVGLFERAISACTRRPDDAATLEQAIDLRFEMRNALQPLGDRDRIFRILLEAESLAERLGDPSRVGWVQSYLTDHYWIRGMTDEAVAAGEKALEIAGRSEDLALRVVTNLPLGLVFHTRGDYPRAIDCFGWNVEHLPGDLATRSFGLFVLPAAFSHSFLAWTLAETGEFDRALAHARRGVQLAEKTRHVMSEGYAELGLGLVHLRRGEADKAVAALRASLAVDAFASSPVGRAYVAYHLGFALAMSGMLHDGLAMLEETVALAEDKGFVARHALRLAHLAEVRAMAGRMAGAAESAQRAIALARNHGERANEAYALRAAGEVALYARERAIAAERLQESLAIAETLGLRPLAANLHRKLAQAFAPSEPTRTVRHARRAEEIATAIGVRFWAR